MLSRALTGYEPELSGMRVRAAAMHGPLVLHTDDEPSLLTLVALILERAGYRVQSTFDANSALEIAEQLRPALIITDIVKPDMSGLELLARLKAHPTLCDISVVVFSACSGADVVTQALALGADDYVVKPCAPDELVSVVSSLVDGGERWAALHAKG